MSDKVIDAAFNDGQKQDKDLFGPPLNPSWHRVVIEGRQIRDFYIRERDGQFEVLFDDRWVYQFPEKWIARIAISMAANAMAVGMGYAYLGSPDKNHPFAPVVVA